MNKKHIVLAGSTGLVGAAFLKQISAFSEDFQVTCLVRSLPIKPIAGVDYVCVDFNELDTISLAAADSIVCCLGTTIKKAGSAEAFRKVDYQYVVNLMRLGEKMGVEAFHVVSAMGANKNSVVLYSRVKGEMQDALQHSSIPSKFVYQPSLLLGNRAEFRFAERLAAVFMKLIAPLMKGKLLKYKAIPANDVAAAILSNLQPARSGYFIVSNADMVQ